MLDLGSGGGIDVTLSAKRVGPTGTAFGLEVADGMHGAIVKGTKPVSR